MGSELDAGGAPGYMGPTPPDRMEMTYGDHLQAALQVMQSRPLDKDEMVQTKTFFVAVTALIKEKLGQGQVEPGAAPQGAGAQPAPSNESEDYGTGYGTPAEGNEYGAIA